MSNAAIIKVSSGSAAELVERTGLFTLLLEHDVKTTKASYDWTGPKIPAEEWARMMAFFEWTHSEHNSEAHTHWFVHPVHGWKCWAFQQRGGTGMTIQTLDMSTGENAEQRKQFGDDWIEYMTVHHHCSMAAFQSGTDEADEKKRDGLHITIGNMDKPGRSLDARFYTKRHKFDPVMNAFWDVGSNYLKDLEAKSKDAFEWLGIKVDMAALLDKQARLQMAQSSQIIRAYCDIPPDPEFPEQWRKNYIVPERVQIVDHQLEHTTNGKDWCVFCGRWANHDRWHCPNNPQFVGRQNFQESVEEARADKKKKKDRDRYATIVGKSLGGEDKQQADNDVALSTLHRDIISQLAIMGYTYDEISDLFHWALNQDESEGLQVIIGEMNDARVSADELYQYHRFRLKREEQLAMEEDAKQAAAEAQKDAEEAKVVIPATTSPTQAELDNWNGNGGYGS